MNSNKATSINTINANNAEIEQSKKLNDWMKLPDFLKKYPQFTNHQMRWLLLHRERNGLSMHTRKLGKPLYIHIPGFLLWLENYSER